MTLSELPEGTPFQFPGQVTTYVSRGGLWYGTPKGYDGGPWCAPQDTFVIRMHVSVPVEVLPTLTVDELMARHKQAHHTHFYQHTSGDRALVEYEFTRRGLPCPE